MVGISEASFKTTIPFDEQVSYLTLQWWVCLGLMGIFLLEFIIAKRKWHFLIWNFPFFLVSIPYTNVLPYIGLNLSSETLYLLSFIPLIRAAYATAYVVGWFSYDRSTRIFVTYFFTMLSVLYFGSLVFYVSEHGVNPQVQNYGDAVWWTAMEVTTVGCNIEAVTTTGKVLSFMVSVCGLLILPLFTVYMQNLIQSIKQFEIDHRKKAEEEALRNLQTFERKTGLDKIPAVAVATGAAVPAASGASPSNSSEDLREEDEDVTEKAQQAVSNAQEQVEKAQEQVAQAQAQTEEAVDQAEKAVHDQLKAKGKE